MTERMVVAGGKLTQKERDELDEIILQLGLGNRSKGVRILVRCAVALKDVLDRAA